MSENSGSGAFNVRHRMEGKDPPPNHERNQ